MVHEGKVAFFTARAWQEDGVWNAELVDLPVVVYGDTFEQAQKHLTEALRTHLATAEQHGDLARILQSLPHAGSAKSSVEIAAKDEVVWRLEAPLAALGAYR